MQLPNGQQIKLGTEHIISSIAGVVGTLAAIGALDPESGRALVEALNQIGEGIGKLIAGVSAAVVAVTTIIASLRGNPLVQMILGAKAVAAAPQIAEQAHALAAEDKAALAKATVEVAKVSSTANKALLETVVENLPNVQGIVVDQKTSDSIPNNLITSEPGDIPKAA